MQGIACHYHIGAQPDIVQSRGGFVELGHFDKLFVKNEIKNVPPGKDFVAYSPRYS